MLVRVTVHFRTDRRENIVSNEHKDDSILLVGTVLISTPALAPAVSVYRFAFLWQSRTDMVGVAAMVM
jgi:hypothetical protein